MKVVKCLELPQWIIESDRAAYHPFSNIIYLTKWAYLPHEFIHYIAYKLDLNFVHKIIDKKVNQSIKLAERQKGE